MSNTDNKKTAAGVVGSKNVETAEKPFDFSSQYSDNYPGILHGLNLSLVVTSYQSQKLFFIRSVDGNSLDVNFKSFSRPMGLAVSDTQITLGTYTQVHRFTRNDAVINKLDDADKVDACFVPSATHTTGMINIHDIAYGDDGLWVTNSAFSCLATLNPDFSFTPRWKPAFIDELKPEDRCHLNGMALQNGKPKYVTTFSRSNEHGAWKTKELDGCLIDVETNEVLISGMIMPHSPRCYRDKVYLCESGHGILWCYDPKTKQKEKLIELPGFVRGMDFYGPLLFLGLSKSRKSDTNTRIPLANKYDETLSGVWVINLETNETIATLRFDGDVDQIYDVAVLANSRYPELLEDDHELVAESFSFPELT